MAIKTAYCAINIDYDDAKVTAEAAVDAVADVIERALSTLGVLDAVGAPDVGPLELLDTTDEVHADAE